MRSLSLKKSARLARQVYAALLYLYPTDFRRGYADEMTLLFVDMYRAAAAQGTLACVRLWLTALLDLLSSALRERMRTMLNSRSAAVIGVILCLPLMMIAVGSVFDFEPPFVPLLEKYMFAADGYTPTTVGRVVMFGLLLSVPVAFVINLLPMFKKADPERIPSFRLTPAHTIIGMSLLLVVWFSSSPQILRELRPFVRPLGSAAIVGQGLCLLGLLPLPVAFLLNRLPRLTRAGPEGAITFQPSSINLIVGAVALLMIIMVVSGFALEATACSIGVPNCD